MVLEYNKPLLAKMRRASREYGLIEDGDKIAVGLSGGKDSTLAGHCGECSKTVKAQSDPKSFRTCEL